MNVAEFEASLSGEAPPTGLSPSLEALWRARKDDWDGAHELVQADQSAEAAWVHAYLHRVEGDLPNAGYWYKRAGKPENTQPLEEEWKAVVTALVEA